ncbi:MAG: DUF2213 domain-containing protein [Spirochaetaceae bacterium]|jgi:hypothetical protein|nr:DUF2213 domain-containing protein [Spirochaetaceae bacterium]
MGEQKTVKRWDSLEPARWMTTPFIRTTDGFLQGRAIVTSVGVFTYRHEDGSITQELRLPEEVFATDSLNSMKLKPVTNDHPTEKVTPDNTHELSVGSLGSNLSSTTQERTWDGYTPFDKLTDGLHVAIDMTITRADAIDDVVNGKRALSMGYECDLEKAEEGAVWCGMAYDHIQRNIRYNHCAIVDKARAGNAAQIHLDSEDAVLEHTISTSKEDNKMGMKTIKIDGVDFQGDETLVVKYTEQVKRADAAEKALEKAATEHKGALSKLEAERDTAKDRADKAEEELKKSKADVTNSKRLDELVAAKLALLDVADRAGVEIKADMSDEDIKKGVITAVFPKAKLDGKDETYISARFDSAVETVESRADGESRIVAGEHHQPETRTDSVTARKRMIELNRRLSTGEKVEA